MSARLDAIDRKILKELQDDGRITNVELARRVGISAPPCLRRAPRSGGASGSTARPPSWTIPTSNVTRVRSEGFSKMRARVRPSRAVECRPRLSRCFSSLAVRKRRSTSSRVRSLDDSRCLTTARV